MPDVLMNEARHLGALIAAPFAGAAWRGVVRRADVLPGLPREVLLHAGPPLTVDMPAAIHNAAVQAILFEGLADSEAQAMALLSGGVVPLLPAQDYGVVTPLAQVVSASMPLAVVGDDARVAFAPLIEGGPPALRFGTLAPEARVRLADVAVLGLDRLDALLRASPIALMPVIAQALAGGDECHGRTGVANAALVASLEGLEETDHATLVASPGFVLPILMAAACWKLSGQTHGIAAAGGNGVAFGVRVHGKDGWFTVAAEPPVGVRFGGHEATQPLPAIGDSAVIDFCGLGGQALSMAPQLRADWQGCLPPDVATRRAAVVDARSGLVDMDTALRAGRMPLVNLAILDRAGTAGLVGRGFYAPPAALFMAAAR